ncbi:MAG TPA: nucleoside 2-deoxyribosyltransferase [Candidatus Bathyarchaeota archaeon]|nr:nucleoside 2-deoxyribosyltransferase [Candidatus Bathyarchaeota archaeon]
MRIYFAGSIRGGEPDGDWFRQLIHHMEGFGEVLTRQAFGLPWEDEMDVDEGEIYRRDMRWLSQADALVAEITAPSLGVGYEVAKAEQRGIPVLLLYKKTPGKKPSAMLMGNPCLKLVEYTEKEEALEAVEAFLSALEAS